MEIDRKVQVHLYLIPIGKLDGSDTCGLLEQELNSSMHEAKAVVAVQ